MKIRFAIAIFFGLFVMPALAEIPKYVCPTLPPSVGVSWRPTQGIDAHQCTAIRTKDKKELFSIYLGVNGWATTDAKTTHPFKGVVAGHSVTWQFYKNPRTQKYEWETTLNIPMKRVGREFTVLISLPQNDSPSTREALNLLSKIHLIFPYNVP